ncbi:MAG: hypothetical protein ACFFCW_23000 [Candidatus Hodarchaeota archaeon]
MAEDRQSLKDTKSQANSFLNRLREYKEFIAILVFVVGGFMWIYGFFATKQQVRVLQCLMNQQIALVESRMTSKFLCEEIVQKLLELQKLNEKHDKSNEEIKRSLEVQEEIRRLRTRVTQEQQMEEGDVVEK